MRNREYRDQMEQIKPDAAALERLYAMVDGQTAPRQRRRRLGRRVVTAAAVCAALAVTALAAGPAVWETLREQLGEFAPYAQTVAGDTAVDQGLELAALQAVSDGEYARIYLSLRDLEGDRLSDNLQTNLLLRAESSQEPLPGESVTSYSFHSRLLSYDPQEKTALLELAGMDIDTAQAMEVEMTWLATNRYTLDGTISLEGITDTLLACRRAEQGDILWRPGDLQGAPEEDGALELADPVVLRPDQNARAVEGTQLFQVSAVGFAQDGYLHISIQYDPSLTVGSGGDSVLYVQGLKDGEYLGYTPQFVLAIEGGMEIVLPRVTPETLGEYDALELYGSYQTPGEDIRGEWVIPVAFETTRPTLMPWTGEAGPGVQVESVQVSPISAVLEMTGGGAFSQESVVAHNRDGSTVASRFVNGSAWEDEEGVRHNLYRWAFEEPVELEDVEYFTFMDTKIPVE